MSHNNNNNNNNNNNKEGIATTTIDDDDDDDDIIMTSVGLPDPAFVPSQRVISVNNSVRIVTAGSENRAVFYRVEIGERCQLMRFSAMYEQYKRIRKEFSSFLYLPEMPPKTLRKKFDNEFVEMRRNALQGFVRKLFNAPDCFRALIWHFVDPFDRAGRKDFSVFSDATKIRTLITPLVPQNSQNNSNENNINGLIGQANFQFVAVNQTELSLKDGDIITNVNVQPSDVEEGWYFGEIGERKGFFPGSYITILRNGSNLKQPPLIFTIEDYIAEELCSFKIDIPQAYLADDYIEYEIVLSDAQGNPLGKYRRRYKEFVQLHKELRRFTSIKKLPLLPPKKFFGGYSSLFIERRRLALESYLRSLLLIADPYRLLLFSIFDPTNTEAAMSKYMQSNLKATSDVQLVSEAEERNASAQESVRWAKALFDYIPENQDGSNGDAAGVGIKAGQILMIKNDSDLEWVEGELVEDDEDISGIISSSNSNSNSGISGRDHNSHGIDNSRNRNRKSAHIPKTYIEILNSDNNHNNNNNNSNNNQQTQ